MAAPGLSQITSLWNAIKLKPPPKAAVTDTATFNPAATNAILPIPQYNDHLTDILTSRQSGDARVLLKTLFKQDPDVSATVGSYLTMANTRMTIAVRDPTGKLIAPATLSLLTALKALMYPTDYTLGFQLKRGLEMLCQEMRYMLMLRGAIAAELVFDKNMVPSTIQQVDTAEIEWFETASGVFKPQQRHNGQLISLDIPSFFFVHHRRDPTTIYPQSDFVSAINTIAARQQVINDLYRIMQITGYPRIYISVMEDVVRKNAPASIRDDAEAMRKYMRDRMSEISAAFVNLRADQPFISYDSTEVSILNEKNPGMAIDISSVIGTLNSQNQAGLKTMATVIGRGDGNSQVAGTEARLAAMSADELNVPLADCLSRMFTFLLNVMGQAGFVEVKFAKAELRPFLELEPQRTLLDARLREDLSLGLITDEEYHLEVHGRLPPAGVPTLAGTGFTQPTTAGVDAGRVSPNQGTMARSLVPEGSSGQQSKSKAVKATGVDFLGEAIARDFAKHVLLKAFEGVELSEDVKEALLANFSPTDHQE